MEVRKLYIVITLSEKHVTIQPLGFKYKKDDNRRALMETPNIASMRAAFFKKYMENKHLEFTRQLVFLDETWIFSKGNKMKSWQDENVKSVLDFASKSKLMDYHGEMHSENFTKRVENQLIPNLEEPSLTVMDNSPYHSVELEKQPSCSWKRGEIVEWLEKNEFRFDKQIFKAELLSLAKLHKKPKKYKIDQLLQANGHEVLRLPPYHCQFNAIEMIWADTKYNYNTHIGGVGHTDENVLEMWQKALEKCTPEV
ncbi:uncharacterized protein LOC126743300 [Anthonomus grandis grandis]|uniref:uncharacterized protein LOC126743300 n=1 Tax=Anthonomus grandis grandis TaxID=2921223 RepID=UPI002166675D|nr:uncharacterized protein LOC126743300 [Anthonomus grandis grandis]